jgi:hypothetical protein
VRTGSVTHGLRAPGAQAQAQARSASVPRPPTPGRPGPGLVDLAARSGQWSIRGDVLARPSHAVREVAGAERAEAVELELVVSELGDADDGMSRGHAPRVAKSAHASHGDGYTTRTAGARRRPALA